ncbi:peptide MFS transporter [Dysgonomonas sp. HDW5A]|uniref:peptide MFS transporter n=1 Tax=Dysgonomonas sp. HDW5A TaxID=2714926 RepID=UPI00140C37EF|nr:peptide MFS transporter [Dysgonomonas sp. HDW5A]QIK61353.1 peptide MFS transporter [Dysgonomonas sp. HDW5A]
MTETKLPSNTTVFGHPVGLYLLFFTELWERFSYYGMRGILMLYLTKTAIEGGIGFDESFAGLIYGGFTGLVYFTPLIGGWLADKYLGQRKAITIGGFTMFLGQMVLFLLHSKFGLFSGLLLLIIGNGFFKPNISTLVGGLYKPGDAKRDSAFSIFYMGINVGAFFAPLVVGLLANDWFAVKDLDGKIISHGYSYGFLAAAIGMLIGQLLFNTLSKKYLGELGLKPVGDKKEKEAIEELGQVVEHKTAPLTAQDKQRTIAIFIYFFFAIFFFAGFEQAGSSFTLYTEKFLDRNVGGFMIPTEWFQSINPLFIVLLTPVFAMFWPSKSGQKITTPVKMGSGLMLLGIGFLFMVGASHQRGGDIADTAVKASMWWIVFTYLLHTIGELCLSPVGLSTVTKLAPPKLASLLMGVWLLSSFFGNLLGGWISSITSSLGAGSVYQVLAIGAIICGGALICLNKILLRMMHGVR